MVIEGKVAGQVVRGSFKIDGTPVNPLCEKCGKEVSPPDIKRVVFKDRILFLRSYLGRKEFIYEAKSGRSLVYCSKYCRNSHNHRFN